MRNGRFVNGKTQLLNFAENNFMSRKGTTVQRFFPLRQIYGSGTRLPPYKSRRVKLHKANPTMPAMYKTA